MTKRARSLLRTPQGTEAFYLEEAYRHRKLTAHVEEIMYRWGYLPVQTPVFDFFEVYEPLFTGNEERKIYRLIDREGDLLMLRSDITIFLARQMGMVLTEEDLPVRACYFDTILRHQNAEDISKNEFFQAGAELIGTPGLRGDIEIVLLMHEVLSQLPLPECRIHIGSRALFDACFGDLTSAEQSHVRHLINVRDRTDLAAELDRLGRSAAETGFLCDLFLYIGNGSDLESVARTCPEGALSADARRELDHLGSLFGELAKLGIEEKFRVDLSEVGRQPYYTGVVFQAYMDGMDDSIASGGRYDKLMSAFGFSAPSVGFSMMIRKLEAVLADSSRYNVPGKPLRLTDESPAEAHRKAQEIRSGGRSATL